MRERRWESPARLTFAEVLAVGERLGRLGLQPAHPARDVICYIEEWLVDEPEAIDQLDPWATEDVTLVHVREGWNGDFFLLAGAYHTVYQRHQSVGTYCSVSHPWHLRHPFRFHLPRAMFWVGFRHTHAFIRVRLQTAEVITPGETRGDGDRDVWLDERRRIFLDVAALLGVPVEAELQKGHVVLSAADRASPFFCSWPDAFGPCQFEYNSADPFEFLVPASRLAATCNGVPATVRAYLTGYTESALHEFRETGPGPLNLAYRCSAHCPLDELPDILEAIAPAGRLYATLCEFQPHGLLARGDEASAIIGIVGADGAFQIEARLNRAPLPDADMPGWLESLLGFPMTYAPLPPFV